MTPRRRASPTTASTVSRAPSPSAHVTPVTCTTPGFSAQTASASAGVSAEPADPSLVVDTYDALASERPYKEAFPEEKCLNIIRDSSGSHFDPEVVNAFFANIDRIRTIRSQWHD